METTGGSTLNGGPGLNFLLDALKAAEKVRLKPLAHVEGKITNGNEPAACLLFVFYPYAIVRPKPLNRRKSAAFAVAMGASAASAVAAIMQSIKEPRRLPD